MSGRVRIAAVTATAAGLILCAAFAPIALRGLDGFAVRRVEVIGARYLPAEAAVMASGITAESNVFDDPNPWIDGLLRHPLVTAARVERRVPATVVLHISEAVPVAFARTPELRAIDQRGRLLPADPAAEDLDLPVLVIESKVDADGVASDERTLRAAAFLGRLALHEPALLGMVSEIGAHGDDVSIILRQPARTEVLAPALPTAAMLRELNGILTELADGLADVRRIDIRFHDQIVVASYGRGN